MRAVKTRSMAPTLTASFKPSAVPRLKASNQWSPLDSRLMCMSLLNSSVSGTKILAATMAAGALMTEAAKRCLAKNKREASLSPPR